MMAKRAKARKPSEAQLARAIRLREQRGELNTWSPDTRTWLQDEEDRRLLRRERGDAR